VATGKEKRKYWQKTPVSLILCPAQSPFRLLSSNSRPPREKLENYNRKCERVASGGAESLRRQLTFSGHAVAQLVEAPCYKPEGRGFDSWCHWRNPSDRDVPVESTPPVTEMSARNISFGGKGGRCVGLTTLQPSCGNCLSIWDL